MQSLTIKKKIKLLQETAETTRDYLEIAQLDFNGSPYSINSALIYTTPLTKLLEGTYTVNGNHLQFLTGPDIEKKLMLVINENPLFPFSYYALAYCLQKRDDKDWVVYANKAVEILKKTTTIPNHNSNHDKVLKELLDELDKLK